jgi:hypothetical protein
VKESRRIWFSARAVRLHIVIIVVVPTFALLCNWQVHRALGGNQLSWAYVFEWPFFAGYAVYMWWRFVHEQPLGGRTPKAADAPTPTADAPVGAVPVIETDDPDQADREAYNRYLGQLAERDVPKHW